jgi:3',5'-cyclic AMP phosphodiesterase CpdA
MAEPEPLVQIFQVSDLHIGNKNRPPALWRWSLRLIPKVGPSILQGLASHDRSALQAFETSAKAMLGASPEWEGKTWIACTGDLSTWGDDGSIKSAITQLEQIAQRCGDLPFVTIYGNHDTWDDGFPMFDRQAMLDQRRTRLRALSAQFATNWPLAPLTCPVTGRRLEIDLVGSNRKLIFCSLNTVMHCRMENSLAHGHVREDRYWEDLTYPLIPQIDSLQAKLARLDQIRVVLTHHPVHHPNPPPRGMVLNYRDQVAQRLATRAGNTPLAGVVVSGHTHKVFPDLNRMPKNATRPRTDWHVPLSDGQLQLIGGTLSQRSWNGHNQPHHWQALRFWQAAPGSDQVIVERIVLRRPTGYRAFHPLGGSEKTEL